MYKSQLCKGQWTYFSIAKRDTCEVAYIKINKNCVIEQT